MSDNGLLWLWFSLVFAPGTKSADNLLEGFGGNIEEIYEAGEERYLTVDKLVKSIIDRLCNKDLSEAKEILAFCKNEGIGILTPDSPLYPARLGRIRSKPSVLYYKGVLRDLEPEVCIAEVGTRTMSEYGSHSAYSIAYDLAKAGAVVVSGMAKGVDGMAHRGALDAGGYTVAVLGNGIERAYPAEHLSLMREIISNGIVITEFKPFTEPKGGNFPLRNRIISGLSQGTVVIEAPKSSGALITADRAAEQGRDIFAVPGKVGELNSSGTNQLIKNGAKIVTCAADILLEYQTLYSGKINLNNIPSIKSEKYRSPISLKVASPRPGLYDTGITERGASEAMKRSEKEIIRNSDKKEPEAKAPEKAKEPRKLDFGAYPSDQAAILRLLSEKKQLCSDDIVRELGLSIGDVLAAMTMLEISGEITALPGGMYTLN